MKAKLFSCILSILLATSHENWETAMKGCLHGMIESSIYLSPLMRYTCVEFPTTHLLWWKNRSHNFAVTIVHRLNRSLSWNLGLCNVRVRSLWMDPKVKSRTMRTSVQNLSITLSTVFKVKKKSQSQVLRDHSLGKSGSFIGKKFLYIRFYNIFGMKNVYLAVCWCARSFNHKRR